MIAPGYRIGWTAPGRFQAKVETLKLTTTLATPTLLQAAIAEFLESGAYDRHLRKMRAAFATQTEQMIAAVGEHFPAGTKVTRPAGGFVLWVELPHHVARVAGARPGGTHQHQPGADLLGAPAVPQLHTVELRLSVV